MSELLKKKVTLASDCVGEEVQKQIEGMGEREVLLLENLRFPPEEEKNDDAFVRVLAAFCNILDIKRWDK